MRTSPDFLGENIKQIRSVWGMAQGDFAAFMGGDVGNTMISNYEKGTSEPSIGFLLRLIFLTGISAEQLCLKLIQRNQIPKDPIQGSFQKFKEAAPVYFKQDDYRIGVEQRLQTLEKQLAQVIKEL